METATDRQERIEWWQQSILTVAQVAIIGAGALGNEVLKNLALMGIGHLHIFDFDTVDVSNLSRTVLFSPEDVGAPKATIAAKRTKELNVNPKAEVRGHSEDILWEVGGGFFKQMDVVLGCLDNLEARRTIGKHCYQFGIPYIDGGMQGLGGRVQLHLTGSGACMDCTIGSAERLAINNRYSCMHVMKSFQAQNLVPTVQITSALVASLMCQEAIKHLHGKPVRFGSVLSWAGEENDFDQMVMVRNPDCPTCSVPPVDTLIEVPIRASDSAATLLKAIGGDWSIILPSPFILSLHCSCCGSDRDVFKPSFRCKDTDFFCSSCDCAERVELSSIHQMDMHTDAYILELSLLQIGVPCSAAMLAVVGNKVALVELTGDDKQTACESSSPPRNPQPDRNRTGAIYTP